MDVAVVIVQPWSGIPCGSVGQRCTHRFGRALFWFFFFVAHASAPDGFATVAPSSSPSLSPHAGTGFSSSAFSQWRKPGTNIQQSYSNIIRRASERGNYVSKLITPTVIAKVKDQFGCYDPYTFIGAEIEDYGSSGTAGSHFEKRVFSNE
jgi:hypothetical protein